MNWICTRIVLEIELNFKMRKNLRMTRIGLIIIELENELNLKNVSGIWIHFENMYCENMKKCKSKFVLCEIEFNCKLNEIELIWKFNWTGKWTEFEIEDTMKLNWFRNWIEFKNQLIWNGD